MLRHQLNILQLRTPRRLYLTWIDRALFVWLYRGYPRILAAITILRPETIVRWHRKGFAAFWRWKSRCACRKSNPDILVMQAAQDRAAKNVTDGSNGARYRGILV